MSSAEWEKRSFIMERFICLFVLLRVPEESTLAENSWQWHIWRGFFKVTALSSDSALLHAFHSSPLRYPRTKRQGGRMTLHQLELLRYPVVFLLSSLINTSRQNPDTTWRNTTHAVTSPKNLNKHERNKINEAFFSKHASVNWVFSIPEWHVINIFLLKPDKVNSVGRK